MPISYLNQKATENPECLAFGFTPLPQTLPNAKRLDEWLAKGFNADMAWMARTAETRKQPAKFNGKNYNAAWIALWKYPRALQKKQEPVAAFAHGKDYHITIGATLREWASQVDGQPFVDSLPIAERELASMAGLGFIGKNTMLINPKLGSGFFIGGILVRAENFQPLQVTPYPKPHTQEGCINCRRCIDACPNNAITEDGFLDSRRCASYLTVEHRGEFSEQQREWVKGRVFGCDICQRVCPYNAEHLTDSEPYFSPEESEWKKSTIKESPLRRAGAKNLKRNYIASRQALVCSPPAFLMILATSGNVEPAPMASAQS